MSSFNKHTIGGTVGTINEVKGNADMPVFSFSVATSDYAGKGKGEPGKDGQATDYATQWHDVVIFGKQADSLSKRLGKGDKVIVEGSSVKENYTKKDGTPGMAVRLKAQSVTIMHSKAGSGAATSQVAASSVMDTSDIPF